MGGSISSHRECSMPPSCSDSTQCRPDHCNLSLSSNYAPYQKKKRIAPSAVLTPENWALVPIVPPHHKNERNLWEWWNFSSPTVCTLQLSCADSVWLSSRPLETRALFSMMAHAKNIDSQTMGLKARTWNALNTCMRAAHFHHIMYLDPPTLHNLSLGPNCAHCNKCWWKRWVGDNFRSPRLYPTGTSSAWPCWLLSWPPIPHSPFPPYMGCEKSFF